MKLIQVLGPDGPQCKRFLDNAQQAVRESGVAAVVEKVTDMDVITGFGVMATPALAIDGEVKVVGRVLSPEEIQKLLAS